MDTGQRAVNALIEGEGGGGRGSDRVSLKREGGCWFSEKTCPCINSLRFS